MSRTQCTPTSLNLKAVKFEEFIDNTIAFTGTSVNKIILETALCKAVIYIKDQFEELTPIRTLIDEAQLEVLCVPKNLDTIPMSHIGILIEHYPQNIKPAYPEFFPPEKMEVLLGAEVSYWLLKFSLVVIPTLELKFQNSVFGLISSG
ncbi:hypothetical protein NPIL_117121 [Nephila pilipes]|uniref:Uncharacterized protein n=1 Tax=Nephila pilipes TaxID=299642 RepID=A0A8X6TVN2_NEPPI|nr:hypothetical protein NPIL_117121 [Nephila pilipes]